MPLRAIENPKARRIQAVARPHGSDATQGRLCLDDARPCASLSPKDRGRIASNPCERGGRLYAPIGPTGFGPRPTLLGCWLPASPEMELALMLALWTGQRQGDLLALPWSAYDGSHIRLRTIQDWRCGYGACRSAAEEFARTRRQSAARR